MGRGAQGKAEKEQHREEEKLERAVTGKPRD